MSIWVDKLETFLQTMHNGLVHAFKKQTLFLILVMVCQEYLSWPSKRIQIFDQVIVLHFYCSKLSPKLFHFFVVSTKRFIPFLPLPIGYTVFTKHNLCHKLTNFSKLFTFFFEFFCLLCELKYFIFIFFRQTFSFFCLFFENKVKLTIC